MSKTHSFNYLKPDFIYIHPSEGEHLWLLQNNEHVSVMDIGYNLGAYPNKIAAIDYNRKSDIKASDKNLPLTANNFYFKINDASLFERYNMIEELPEPENPRFHIMERRNATQQIVNYFLGNFICDIVGKERKLNFAENCTGINFYPAAKNKNYLNPLKTLFELVAFPVNISKVPTGGNKNPDAIALSLG